MNSKIAILVALLVPFAACGDAHEDVAEQVRALDQQYNDAYAANDLDAYFSYYAPDAMLIFDQARTTIPDYRAEWHALIDAGGGVESVVMSDVRTRVLAGGDVVAVSYLVDTATRSPEGEVTVDRAFETDIWEKRADGWKVVLLHFHNLAGDE